MSEFESSIAAGTELGTIHIFSIHIGSSFSFALFAVHSHQPLSPRDDFPGPACVLCNPQISSLNTASLAGELPEELVMSGGWRSNQVPAKASEW